MPHVQHDYFSSFKSLICGVVVDVTVVKSLNSLFKIRHNDFSQHAQKKRIQTSQLPPIKICLIVSFKLQLPSFKTNRHSLYTTTINASLKLRFTLKTPSLFLHKKTFLYSEILFHTIHNFNDSNTRLEHRQKRARALLSLRLITPYLPS